MMPRKTQIGTAAQAALIAECFTPHLRYSGASIGYQLSSIISGWPCPADRNRTARGIPGRVT
jgi:hypothetical protein